jgi:hypothetical protein
MATAAPEATAAPAAGGGKKKLILIIVIALVVVLVGAGAAVMLLKKKPPAEEGEDGEETTHVEAAAHKPGTPAGVSAHRPLHRQPQRPRNRPLRAGAGDAGGGGPEDRRHA